MSTKYTDDSNALHTDLYQINMAESTGQMVFIIAKRFLSYFLEDYHLEMATHCLQDWNESLII